jgi:hypothetical protein
MNCLNEVEPLVIYGFKPMHGIEKETAVSANLKP